MRKLSLRSLDVCGDVESFRLPMLIHPVRPYVLYSEMNLHPKFTLHGYYALYNFLSPSTQSFVITSFPRYIVYFEGVRLWKPSNKTKLNKER